MTEAPPKLPVLVVDDSPFSRKLLEHALAGDSYSPLFRGRMEKKRCRLFKEAPDGDRDHRLRCCRIPPDPSFAKRIRAESTGSYTYIILLTA